MKLPLLPATVRWLGVIVIAAFIFYSSLVTVPETVVDDAQPYFIELNHWRHLVAYFTLASSLAYATVEWDVSRRKRVIFAIVLASGFGIAMEAGQAMVPHRSDFLISDATVNTIGASLVIIFYFVEPYIQWTPYSEYIRIVRKR